jgi:hypothetical protein
MEGGHALLPAAVRQNRPVHTPIRLGERLKLKRWLIKKEGGEDQPISHGYLPGM